jgi:hypothetical protein
MHESVQVEFLNRGARLHYPLEALPKLRDRCGGGRWNRRPFDPLDQKEGFGATTKVDRTCLDDAGKSRMFDSQEGLGVNRNPSGIFKGQALSSKQQRGGLRTFFSHGRPTLEQTIIWQSTFESARSHAPTGTGMKIHASLFRGAAEGVGCLRSR